MNDGHGRILLFRGKGWLSRAIRWQTRSPYSHAALLYQDGQNLLESWQGVGVRSKRVTRWDDIDVFRVSIWTHDDWCNIFRLGQKLIGCKYDYLSVLRFVSRRKAPGNRRYFCSELVLALGQQIGKPLLRGIAAEQSPRDLSLCPYLSYEHRPLA